MGKLSLDENFYVRYRNRKLYSWAISSYVTLTSLFEKVENGIDVKIIDKANQKDVTALTLAKEAVTHYANTLKINPNLEQVRELIAMIKSWPKEGENPSKSFELRKTRKGLEVKSSVEAAPQDTVTVSSGENGENGDEKVELPKGAGNVTLEAL